MFKVGDVVIVTIKGKKTANYGRRGEDDFFFNSGGGVHRLSGPVIESDGTVRVVNRIDNATDIPRYALSGTSRFYVEEILERFNIKRMQENLERRSNVTSDTV